jgi:hypothetical protein
MKMKRLPAPIEVAKLAALLPAGKDVKAYLAKLSHFDWKTTRSVLGAIKKHELDRAEKLNTQFGAVLADNDGNTSYETFSKRRQIVRGEDGAWQIGKSYLDRVVEW